jgi:hypothetical protein
MRLGVVLAVVFLVAGDGGASNDTVVNVAQPLIGYDQGLEIGFEGYAGYGMGNAWDGLVGLTCAENSTRAHGALQNRNAASLVGLQFRYVPKVPQTPEGPRFEPYFGDTLRVALIVPDQSEDTDRTPSELRAPMTWRGVTTLRQIVCATIECAVINCARTVWGSKYPIRFLAVDIEGWDGAEDLARTYPLDELPALEKLYRRDSYGGVVRPSLCD